MNSNPFFIVGVPRSGTTLLAVLLNNHSDIYVGKTSLGLSLAQLHRGIMQSYGLEGDCRSLTLEERLLQAVENEKLVWEICADVADQAKHGLRALIECAAQHDAHQQGKRIWGNKSPEMLVQMPQLTHLMPGARFIHIIRDGRAVAQSRHARRNLQPTIAIHSWKHMILTGRIDGSILGSCQYIEVQFEELIRQPEQVLRQTCEFLGVEFEVAMLDLGHTEAARQPGAYVKKQFDSSKIDGWQAKLSPQLTRELEAIAGDLLQELGYPLLHYSEAGPFKMLSPLRTVWYHEQLHLNDLMQRARVSMISQQLVRVSTPFRARLQDFIRRSVSELLSDGVIEHFRQRRVSIM